MAWVAVDETGEEWIYGRKPYQDFDECTGKYFWNDPGSCVMLPKGTIEKLIGRILSWREEPVELG